VASARCLPVVDEFGFYEIRLDSIGGLGAHLAGQILGEAAVLKMGLNALHFSSYGSEKKGSPIRSFVRFAESNREIRSCSPVERPHLVAVFHDALLRTPGALAGLRAKGVLILNTRKQLEDLERFGLPTDCSIYRIDALSIAIEEKSRVNTAMMGAVTRASGFLDQQAVLDSLSETFTKKHPSAVGPNERTFQRGYEELELVAEPRSAPSGRARRSAAPTRAAPQFGYLTAPLGGISAGFRFRRVRPLRPVRLRLPGSVPGVEGREDQRRRRVGQGAARGDRLPLLQGLHALRRLVSLRRHDQGRRGGGFRRAASRRDVFRDCALRTLARDARARVPWIEVWRAKR
jgi:2-oxoacid:acceptor oxidoreductase gamma subunit (pyruvate/2-ketoisovalerate family)